MTDFMSVFPKILDVVSTDIILEKPKAPKDTDHGYYSFKKNLIQGPLHDREKYILKVGGVRSGLEKNGSA